MTKVVPIIPAIGLFGCAPGSLAFSTGDDVLRTAMYQVQPVDGLQRVDLILSNGIFSCDLPNDPDPIVQSQELLELTTATCRENARHVLIELYRGDGADWVGRFPGDSNAHPSLISASRPRLSNASYYGIDEAEMVSVDGFVRTYGVRPGGDVQARDVGDGGEVEILADAQTLRGRFAFPSADISGDFRAVECPAGSTLFALLAQSPVASCPTIGN